jgi:hypothetical protein
MPIKHAFTSPKSDGADATLARPSDWNADHTGLAGSSFPGSPANNDLFFHTTHDMLFFYDGTRWLTTTLYIEPIGITAGAVPYSASTTANRVAVPLAGAMAIWIENYWLSFFVSGGTALSASHKWVCAIQSLNASVATPISSFSIDSGSVSVWRNSGPIAVGVVNPATEFELEVVSTKTGTPGTLYPLPRISYRLIGT